MNDRLSDNPIAVAEKYLRQLAPHVRDREGAQIMRTLVDDLKVSVPVSVLRDHYLRAIECHHPDLSGGGGADTLGMDKAHCSCSTVDLGWHACVMLAVESWVLHVVSVARHGN